MNESEEIVVNDKENEEGFSKERQYSVKEFREVVSKRDQAKKSLAEALQKIDAYESRIKEKEEEIAKVYEENEALANKQLILSEEMEEILRFSAEGVDRNMAEAVLTNPNYGYFEKWKLLAEAGKSKRYSATPSTLKAGVTGTDLAKLSLEERIAVQLRAKHK